MRLVIYQLGSRVSSILFLLAISTSSFADFSSTVVSVLSGSCMTVENNNLAKGANVFQLQCDGGKNQLFDFKKVVGSSNVYTLVFKHSGKCLDVNAGSTDDGANIQQWSCNNSPAQKFVLGDGGRGHYSLRAQVSGKVLDVYGASLDNSANIIQWKDHGQNNQRWIIDTNSSPIPVNTGVSGAWGSVIKWPEIAISAANLPDGRILTWSSTETNAFPSNREFSHASIFDPQTGGFQSVDNNFHDMFCAGVSMLEDGRVVASGGNPKEYRTSSFSPVTMEWSSLAKMNDRRWYATNLTLPNNKIFSTFGKSSGNRSERYDPFSNRWTRTRGADLQDLVNEQNAENAQATVNKASNIQA